MKSSPFIKVWNARNKSIPETHSWNAIFGLELISCSPSAGVKSYESTNRIEIDPFFLKEKISKQIDFVSAMHSTDFPSNVFELRYIITPGKRSYAQGKTEAALLFKLTGTSEIEVTEKSNDFIQSIVSPFIFSFFDDYNFDYVADEGRLNYLLHPMEIKSIAELRRRESLIPLNSFATRPTLVKSIKTKPESNSLYYIHPFIPIHDSFTPIIKTLLISAQPTMISVTLSPEKLTHEEQKGIYQEIARGESFLKDPVINPIFNARAEILCLEILRQKLRLEDAPFLMKIQIASNMPVSRNIVEALGVSITKQIGKEEPDKASIPALISGGYDCIYPADENEHTLAVSNFQELNFDSWGKSSAPQYIKRMRFMVDAYEASSAFRLPIPSLADNIGIDVKLAPDVLMPKAIFNNSSSGSSNDQILIGFNSFKNEQLPVYLKYSDRHQHTYCVGKTGTGKSTLLKSMIVNDMHKGKGLIFLDPHGDLFTELIGLIPENRIEDVVVFNPCDTDFPVGLNLLETHSVEERYFIIDEIQAIMRRILKDDFGSYSGNYSGPAFYTHIKNNLKLILSNPENPATLIEFHQLFQERKFWKKWLLPKWKEELLISWIKGTLIKMDYTYRSSDFSLTWGEYIANKFENFVFDPKLRYIFGQKKSTFKMSDIMDHKKILLVNLAKGDIGEENSRFLGMILVAKILATAMERKKIKEADRVPCYLYIDEFQNFATSSFEIMFSEARKFGLCLTLANQFLTQIEDKSIIRSIFGNVGTIVSFRVGNEDAEKLAPYFKPVYDTLSLSNLPNWNALIKTNYSGEVLMPFNMRTYLPEVKYDEKIAKRVIESSRKKFGTPVNEVKKRISASLKHPDLTEIGKATLLIDAADYFGLTDETKEMINKLPFKYVDDIIWKDRTELRDKHQVSEKFIREMDMLRDIFS